MPKKFEHKKSLGQHFLNSEYVPKKMCDAGSISAGDMVVEIGPGTGALTQELLKRGAKVIAVEADERAITILDKDFQSEIESQQLTIHHQDARSLDFISLGLTSQSFKVIANIPYYISGLLFRTCLETTVQPSDLVFLVQKEVAERIARSKKESILSLSVKVFGDPAYICTVKQSHFTPPPAVDSAVIAVENISHHNLQQHHVRTRDYFDLLHLALAAKRKQLVGNIVKDTRFSRHHVLEILEKLHLPADVRAEDMTPKQFIQFVHHLVHK